VLIGICFLIPLYEHEHSGLGVEGVSPYTAAATKGNGKGGSGGGEGRGEEEGGGGVEGHEVAANTGGRGVGSRWFDVEGDDEERAALCEGGEGVGGGGMRGEGGDEGIEYEYDDDASTPLQQVF